jgi:putative nucleotidyltransferase with HDIG domain
MKNPPFGWAASDRSLTLLRVFLLASAAILVVGALVLGSALTSALRNQAIADERDASNQYVQAVLDPIFDVGAGRLARIEQDPAIALPGGYAKGNTTFLNDQAIAFFKKQLSQHFVSVKVWSPAGVLAWSNLGPGQVGKRFPRDEELLQALRERRPVASMTELTGADNAPERTLGLKRLLEIYAPLIDKSGRVIGGYEVYVNPSQLEHSITARKHEMWLAVGLVFAALYLALILLVRTASRALAQRTRALRQRSKELVDAYAKLEQSSMEAIESLNATVDARDPYTAGHSQRVQRIALAIGEQMGLASDRMRVLAFGALFHDIGKLGVPDAILLKPGRLTDEEYTIIKRHAEEGASIIERFSPLRPAVPVIRHHHEHFTGGGYPLGLAGHKIPLEAAVVGLADAWDAMTTDRPYRTALTDADALEEIRTCSGSQFDPEIVEAFLTAYEIDPARFGSGELPYELPQFKLASAG